MQFSLLDLPKPSWSVGVSNACANLIHRDRCAKALDLFLVVAKLDTNLVKLRQLAFIAGKQFK